MRLNSLKSRSSIAILVAALLLFVAGCGGSSDSSSEESTTETTSGLVAVTMSKKAYAKKADLICKDVPKHYVEIRKKLEAQSKGKKLSKQDEVSDAIIPPLERAIKELQELGSPKGERPKAQAIITAMEAAVQGLEEKPSSNLRGRGSPFAEFQNLTKKYGLEYCPSL